MIEEARCNQTVPPDAVREIQVPEAKIAEVQGWLSKAGLTQVRVVPFEYWEMREVIEKERRVNKGEGIALI